jgi:ABC-type sugar transport system ATPase subunit
VDVGAKQEIVDLLHALAAEGCAVVVASSVLDELLQLSNRILVLNRGRATAELDAAGTTKDQLILAATT